MARENKTKDIVVSDQVLQGFQAAIDNCAPVIAKATHTLQDSLTIANGIKHIKAFLALPEVKDLVIGLQDNVAGFLTDRDPITLAKQNAKKQSRYQKEVYTYEETCVALVPCLMEGYRLTGNEINIIAGKGMPVKAGKFRKITEFPGVTDFKHSIGTPNYDGKIAKMRCMASWLLNGDLHTIGADDKDICIIAVEKENYDGIDKLIGLADSKLFSRVLTRLSGRFVAEGDVATHDVTPQKIKLPHNTPAKAVKKETVNNLVNEWDELINSMSTAQQDLFDRECPCPVQFHDLQSEDQGSRLNDLKNFLKK